MTATKGVALSPWAPKACRAGSHPKVVTKGPKNLRPTPGWRPVEIPTQTSQLEETVDEAIVVQV